MIRDPSDGSVREPHKPAPVTGASQNIAERDPSVMPDSSGAGTTTRKESLQVPVIEAATSGLPLGSSKPENIAKLEKSREWLKNYFHRKTEGT